MKVRNLYFGAAVAAVALCASTDANAQTVYESETIAVTEFECDPNPHYFSNWRNNWFIQLGAGINQPFVERGDGIREDIKAIDRKRMTVAYNFGFGRWFSPYLGFRINAIGGAMHWDNPTLAQPHNGWTRAKHVNVNFELMWDMFNSLGGVNANRVFSIIPFAGFGGDYMWRIHDSQDNFAAASNINGKGEQGIKDESWTLPVTAGIQFRFRLCKYVDFFAEARATFYGDNWNNCSYGDPIEANVAAIGGFNINFGGRGWNTFNECDYVNQIADLNNQVNALRGELLSTTQALAACEAQLPCPEPVVQKDCVNAPLMTTVRFTINSAKIMPTEEVNVYNMAEWLKANPNEKVNIVGYADKDTGTAEYNMQLSEKRANAVADALVNTYGISRDRLNIRFDGSDVQPYSTNDWNRIVIFTQK
ncbi:MAG: OmpA family protein [Muribaculaceae bacterium]|nr:OmpA family protein [Muribaculaceae bacterium]